MKHTLESLLALASTDEGKQQVNALVAHVCGGDEPITKWEFKWRMSQKFSDWNDYPCFSAKASAESARSEEIASGCEVTEVESYLVPAVIPDYVWSLDAIMPEVRKLNEGEKARFLNELQSVCAVVVSRHFTLARAMLSADPIHHCIALLLSLQA